MSVFSQFREQLKANNQDMDKVPALKVASVEMEVMKRSHVPFIITNAEPVEKDWGKQIAYNIQVLTTSKEHQALQEHNMGLAPEYTMWIKATQPRVDQLDLLKPYIEQKTPMVLVGPQNSREWDFDVKE